MSVTREETPKQRLLARQVSLLRHLTDPRAFEGGLPVPALAGLDQERLRLVGNMSFDKRMSKIRTALPRTFTYVPHVDGMSEADFASRFPPYTNLRSENAQQFVDYLRQLWNEWPMEPSFLPDLAAVEAAIVKVNGLLIEQDGRPPDAAATSLFRTTRNVELLHCRHDVQMFFAAKREREPPVARDVRLLIAGFSDRPPRICEVSPKVHDLLRRSADWRPTDLPEILADPELPGLIRTLTKMQIIEMVP